MKGCGWALIVFGGLAVLGMFAGLAMGREPNGGAGVILLWLDYIYCIVQNKKKKRRKNTTNGAKTSEVWNSP
jgi:hypothetical protein